MSRMSAAFLTVLLAVVAPAFAATSDEAAVAKAFATLSEAIVKPDAAALKKVTWPELSYGHSAGLVENQTQFIDALVEKRSVITAIENPKMNTGIMGDTAITRGTATFTIVSAGTTSKVDLTLLMVWQKRGGEWRLLARQAYKF